MEVLGKFLGKYWEGRQTIKAIKVSTSEYSCDNNEEDCIINLGLVTDIVKTKTRSHSTLTFYYGSVAMCEDETVDSNTVAYYPSETTRDTAFDSIFRALK